MSRRFFFRIVFAAFFISSAAAQSSVEVVQSTPLETTLATPGIRETQVVWLEMVRSAKKTIDLEQFYVSNQQGSALDPILNALIEKAASGVRVRLIVDAGFYAKYPANAKKLGASENIEVRTIEFKSTGGIQHAKFFIVDGTQSFVGSANLDWLALSHIHEVGLKIVDKKIGQDMGSVFNSDWEAATPISADKVSASKKLAVSTTPQGGLPTFHLVASPTSRKPEALPDTLSELLKLLASAKKEIKIQVYQFAIRDRFTKGPFPDLDNAIRAAAARGVHVQLLVDAVSMSEGGVDLQALNAVDNIEVRKVVIPEWSGGHMDFARLVHSKYVVVDETSGWVGSENWTGNYFVGSRNVGVIFQSAPVAIQLNKIFQKVWNSPYTTPVE